MQERIVNARKMAYASFVVTQDDRQWECRPSLSRGETIPFIFVAVGMGSLCGAVAFWQTGNLFIRLAFCLPLAGVAGLSFWQAAHAWRRRITPLVVESN